MATRTSIRPRPVDISRQLNIVRDVAELDNTDELESSQNQAPVAAFEQAPPAGPQKKKKEIKEIPVPEVRIVPGYTREYLPLFRIPETYIRGKGGVGWAREDYCEYDLDNEDEDWLDVFNSGGANRLSEERFEQMLWRLELANAEANQRLMSEPGFATDWRMLPAAVAATSNMNRDEALSVLRKYACARDPILHAVYDYWRGKRERWNKPIMRRLQAPTNPSDTNPYNVFRPRERVNRPQTRRRRENTQDCLDKMRQIRESMLKALEMTELLTFREARKRDILRLDVDMQRYQVARHHQPRHHLEAIEAEGAAQLQEAQARSRQGESRLRAYLDSGSSLGPSSVSYDSPLRRALMRKRRRQDMEGCVNGEAIARLPPPPMPPDEEMLVLFTPDLARLLGASSNGSNGNHLSFFPAAPPPKSQPVVGLPPGLDLRCVRPRVSRGGRTMLTRCDPLTLEPHAPASPPSPPHPTDPSAGAAAAPDPASFSGRYSPPTASAIRHPLLHSSQTPNLPWAACLDLDLLPEGIADKAALLAQRERRINADRLNAAMLRQTHQALHQQAAGGMVGSASVAGAAAAAAVAAAAAATASQMPIVTPAPAPPPAAATPGLTQRPPPPPPPPSMPSTGAPAGTLPHIPQGAPAGTLPHVPHGSAAASVPPPASGVATHASSPATAAIVSTPAAVAQPSSNNVAGPTPVPAAVPGSAGVSPSGSSLPAPGSTGAQQRKVPKVPGAAAPSPTGGTVAARSPAPGAAVVPGKQSTSASAGPGGTPAPPPSGGGPHHTPQHAVAGATPTGAATPAPPALAAASPVGATAAPVPSPPLSAPPASGSATPSNSSAGGAAAVGAGTGPSAKKLLSTSKAVAGPSAAAQLKRGPGRPPKAAKATPNGDAAPQPLPPSNTTVPMDML